MSITRSLRAAPGPEAPLGERGGVAVVLDPDREAEPRPQQSRHVHVGEREVDRAGGPARVLVDPGGNPEAERRRLRAEQGRHLVFERDEQLRLGGRGRYALPAGRDGPVPLDESTQDLRAAEVDADDAGCAHEPRLPYPAG